MIRILFENDDILIVDKPAGLASQPGERVGSSVLSVVERERRFKPFPVHRLDKETSGCMILAKNAAAASRWSDSLGERNIRKIYRAVCAGAPLKDRGSYSDDLVTGGKSFTALTYYTCMARFGKDGDGEPSFSLLELELGTGRTHQIRAHLAYLGHPVLGDAELIVGLSASGDADQGKARMSEKHMGAIDSNAVKQLVEEVLEGGKDAFEMRRLKYGF